MNSKAQPNKQFFHYFLFNMSEVKVNAHHIVLHWWFEKRWFFAKKHSHTYVSWTKMCISVVKCIPGMEKFSEIGI